jgi:lipopolysaccharide export system protein LptC
MTTSLRGLAPRAGAAPDQQAFRRIVVVFRWILPAIALLLVGLVMAWPQLVGRGAGLIAPMLAPGEMEGAEVMRMHQPRYVGQTKDAEPFELTAASASLDPISPNLVHLEQLAADVVQGRRDLRIAAAAGIYDRDQESVDLSGGIELTTSDGFRFETPSASLNLDRGHVLGREPIAGAGPAGTLSAQRFEFENGGEVLRFNGRVRVTWQPGLDVGS